MNLWLFNLGQVVSLLNSPPSQENISFRKSIFVYICIDFFVGKIDGKLKWKTFGSPDNSFVSYSHLNLLRKYWVNVKLGVVDLGHTKLKLTKWSRRPLNRRRLHKNVFVIALFQLLSLAAFLFLWRGVSCEGKSQKVNADWQQFVVLIAQSLNEVLIEFHRC